MTIGLIIGIIAVVLVLWILLANIRIVPQAEAYVIERLGKYKATWNAGLHLKTPFIERVARRVTLKEQVLDFPPQPVITKDNVTMQVDSLVFMTVMEPMLYNAKMQMVLDEATDAWGIKVTRVEIKNIQPPQEIEEVMSKQMRAERERRQTVLEAQAHQEAVVARAEGDKQAKILAAEAERDAQIALAEGKARSIELVYQAEADGLEKLKKANISETVLKLKGIEALKDVSDGRATKIYMPSDIANVVTSLGVIGESLGIGDATPIDTSPKPPKPLEHDDCCDDGEKGRGSMEAAATSALINAQFSRR